MTPGQTIGAGSSFDVMTYASRTGDFATVFPIPAGQTFQRVPGPTSYRISATTPPPAVLSEVNRIVLKDVLPAERRPDNILVQDQQQLQTDEKNERRR